MPSVIRNENDERLMDFSVLYDILEPNSSAPFKLSQETGRRRRGESPGEYENEGNDVTVTVYRMLARRIDWPGGNHDSARFGCRRSAPRGCRESGRQEGCYRAPERKGGREREPARRSNR